jgi:hypothetical protein
MAGLIAWCVTKLFQAEKPLTLYNTQGFAHNLSGPD